MKTLDEASSRELELEQVKRAIVATDASIANLETALANMRRRQIARHREVVMQEMLMRAMPPNAGTQRPGTPDESLETETRKPGSLK